MSKVLITGHSGLLGSNLARLLVDQGHEVLGVSRTNRLDFENSFETDLTNTRSTSFIFNKYQPQIVYHLAACAAEAKGQVSPVDMTRRNLFMSANVISASVNVGAKKIIYASSVSVYGDAPTPYDEQSIPVPKDVYGVNKLAGERILKIMAEVYGFDYTIFRPHNLYGPGQNPNDLTKNVINLFMRKLLQGESYAILGDGKVRRGFSYVDDVAESFAKALKNYSGVTMNVGTETSNTIEELSTMLQQISGSKVPVEKKPLRKQEIDVFIADHKVQRQYINYHETPLHEGLEKTWKWMCKQELGDVLEIKKEIYV